MKKEEKLKKVQVNQVPFLKLLSLANKKQKFLMTIGGIAATINGLPLPLQTLILGDVINSFKAGNTVDETVNQVRVLAYWFIFVGLATFFLSWVSFQTWIQTGEQLTLSYRKKYFDKIMQEDIDWFDEQNTQILSNKMMDEALKISESIGEKVPSFINTISLFVFGISLAFIKGWQLSLICCGFIPVIAFCAFFYVKQSQDQEVNIEKVNKEPLKQAGEAFSSIKTIKCQNSQQFTIDNYTRMLKKIYNISIKYSLYVGLSFGLIWFSTMSNYAYGFWFGSVLLENNAYNHILGRHYEGGDVMSVFLSIMWGSFGLGQAAPYLQSFGNGKQAGYNVFKMLDSKSKIQSETNNYTINNDNNLSKDVIGNILFKNVEFSYKSKKNIKVLDKLSMEIKQGQSIALVGESGCGKSTIISLLQRFYDVDEGEILIDGKNIKDIDLNWYRQNVGLISQQPVLFATSIRDNIKIGKQDATDEEIFTALKKANAYDFVMNLEQQLDTFVGNQGVSQLSGGQKQRISIARAILKNPKILLLDEATSALDRKNEQAIQQTIQDAFKGKTVITIAHRLKTIENCDVVYAIENGKVVQQGKYQDLVEQEGYLKKLLKKSEQEQQKSSENLDLQQDYLQIVKQEKSDENIYNLQTDMDLVNLQTDGQLNKEPKKEFLVKKNSKDFSKQYQNNDQKQNLQQKNNISPKKRIYRLSYESTGYAILASIFSLAAGSCVSVMTIYLIKMIEVLIRIDVMEQDEFREESNYNCMLMFIISLSLFLTNGIQYILWNKVALNLTDRLRKMCFKKILNMKIAWYDQKENNVYKLQKLITHDTQSCNSLVSTQINVYLQVFSSLVSGLLIAFFHDWRTSIVGLIAVPLIFIASTLQNDQVKGFSEKTNGLQKESGNLIQETVSHIKIVYSYTCQQVFSEMYLKKLQNIYQFVPSQSLKIGILYGLSQMISYFVYATLFYTGSHFYREYSTKPVDMLTSIFVLMYSSYGAGTQLQFMTNVGDSVTSAKNIFEILDQEDEIQEQDKAVNQQKLIKNGKINGKIQFKNVSFKYPTRDEQILSNISFVIEKGQKIAFVGESGCGKSTIVQLLAKLYTIDDGSIYIDDIDIDNYELSFLRSQFGIVNQEPDLFSGSIYDNIKYNSGNTIDNQEIEKISRLSLVHDFIQEDFQLENSKQNINTNNSTQFLIGGYFKDVGEKGSNLSVGQKQRIAIARSLLKKPQVLLLDEATSALDIKNEELVQQNIDKEMKNNTQIAVAHRISTIINSDQILVLIKGQIVEQGTYEQLKQKQGYFYKLENGIKQNN